MLKRAGLIALGLCVLVGFAILGSKLLPPSRASTGAIRIGVLKHESALPFFVADEQGMFKREGVEVELVELPPGDHMPALLADRVDMVSPTSFPTLLGIMEQHPKLLFAIHPGAEVIDGPNVYGIVVRPDSALQSIKEVKGGVLLAINPFTKVNLEMILTAAGVPKPDWPDIRTTSRESALQAVKEGSAQAAILDQPSLAIAIASREYRLLEANPRARYVGSPYWSGAGAIKQELWTGRQADLSRVMRAIDSAIGSIRTDPASAHRLLARRLGLSPEIAAECGGYYFPLTSEAVPTSGIDSTISALVESQLLKGTVPTRGMFPPRMYGEP